MKKVVSFAFFAICLSIFTISCSSTLQEDIYVSTEASAEVLNAVSEFETSFLAYDADFAVNQTITISGIGDLINSLENKLQETHEPAIIARLQAMDGLLYLMQNKGKKAQELFKEAKINQASDVYVILLESRLEKTSESAVEKIDAVLTFDNSNGILLLEKGKLLYRMNQYDNAIAAFDNAFLILDNDNQPQFRSAYQNLRDKAWKMYSAQIDEATLKTTMKSVDLNSPLTKDGMLIITEENSILLNDFTGSGKISNKELTKKLTAYGVFSSAVDKNNENNSAAKLLNANAMSRILAARFIWNLYVEQKGKPQLRTRYSERYKKLSKTLSPIADVPVENEDFDAVLGVVENEIMDLPDGKSFFPDDLLNGIDFLEIIKKLP